LPPLPLLLAAAIANTTGFLTYETASLEQWMESSIYVLKTTQINMADL
jgi:hypothetical protein